MFGRMMGLVGQLLFLVGQLLLMPAVLLHDLTHYVAARPVSDEIAFYLDLWQPGVMVDWSRDVPEWRLRIAKVAPTLVGLTIGPALALWLLRGPTTNAYATILIVALWGIYTCPSGNDLKPLNTGGSVE